LIVEAFRELDQVAEGNSVEERCGLKEVEDLSRSVCGGGAESDYLEICHILPGKICDNSFQA
jgi:hypothetical protein